MKMKSAVLAVGLSLPIVGCGASEEFDYEKGLLERIEDTSGESYDETSNNIVSSSVIDLANGRTLRIIEVTDSIEHVDHEVIKRVFNMFDNLSQLHATVEIPYAEADKEGWVVAGGMLAASIEPVSKTDHVLFSVPAEMDTNPVYGNPSIFTDYAHFEDETVSITRPNTPGNGLFTEACQSTANVVIDFDNSFDETVTPVDKAGIQLAAQEVICNGLSRAIFARVRGVDYANYLLANDGPNSGPPNIGYKRENGTTDIFVDFPVVDEGTYSALSGEWSQSIIDGLQFGPLAE